MPYGASLTGSKLLWSTAFLSLCPQTAHGLGSLQSALLMSGFAPP